jgi:hypothetical protein
MGLEPSSWPSHGYAKQPHYGAYTKRSLYRYLMVETTAAHFPLRQQKSSLANRPSLGQPVTTNPGSV